MDYKKGTETGSIIKNIRISHGMTMEDFGKEFTPRVTKGTVSKWESGAYLPNPERLKRIAEIGNVSVQYLLNGYDTKTKLAELNMMLHEIQPAINQITSSKEYNSYVIDLNNKKITNLVESIDFTDKKQSDFLLNCLELIKIVSNYEKLKSLMSNLISFSSDFIDSSINNNLSEVEFKKLINNIEDLFESTKDLLIDELKIIKEPKKEEKKDPS